MSAPNSTKEIVFTPKGGIKIAITAQYTPALHGVGVEQDALEVVLAIMRMSIAPEVYAQGGLPRIEEHRR